MFKRYKFLILLLLCCSYIGLYGQSEKDLKKMARNCLYYENYKKAAKYYKKLDSLAEGENPEYRYNIAISYLRSNLNKTKAVKYLEGLTDYADDIGVKYYYNMGYAYHLDYQFDNAISQYNKFLDNAKEKNKLRDKVQRSIEMCKNGKKLVQDSFEVRIENLGANINTEFAEYSPMVSADESSLIFTSRREGSLGGLQTPSGEKDTLYGKYYEDIYVSINVGGEWKNPVSIGRKINTNVHDAAIGLSPDGKELFVYRSDSVRWGNIYRSKSDYKWKKPEKMPKPINSQYWEGPASLSTDGRTLYFTSNRPGGEGKRDIYVAHKRIKTDEQGRVTGSKWSKPENLGPKINTPYHDMAPFLHADNQTLYFASKGHNSMGGYDIFVAKKKNGEWQEPKNIGYPINTPDDDAHLYVSGDGKRAYYASASLQGYGGLDLYVIHLPKDFPHQPDSIALVKGQVKAAGFQAMDRKLPSNTKITIKEDSTGDTVGMYRPNTKTGEYMISVPMGKEYKVTAKAPKSGQYKQLFDFDIDTTYVEQSINITIPSEDDSVKEAGTLDPSEPASQKTASSEAAGDKGKQGASAPKSLKKSIKIVHFGFDASRIKEEERDKMDSLTQILSTYKDLQIKIVGYTDSVGPKGYNIRLSKQRAQAARSYLLEKGITKERLTIDAMGEKNPIAPNTNPDGSDNPEGRAKNRRVEFSIID